MQVTAIFRLIRMAFMKGDFLSTNCRELRYTGCTTIFSQQGCIDTMSKKSVIALVVACGLFSASSAFADHNSIWGAGSANMPNDIHNSAIEDDQDVFMDLVQYGDGADSVNRYDDSTDATTTAMGAGSPDVDIDTSTMRTDTTTMVSSSRMTAGGGALVTRSLSVSRGGSRR